MGPQTGVPSVEESGGTGYKRWAPPGREGGGEQSRKEESTPMGKVWANQRCQRVQQVERHEASAQRAGLGEG